MSLLWICLFVAFSAAAQTTVDPARVERLLRRAVVIDLHSDTTQMILNEGYNLGELHDYGQVDIPRLRRGQVSAVFLASCPNSRRLTPPESARRALEEIDAVRGEVERHRRDLELATTAEQILAARRNGRIAVLLGLEGGHIIDSNLALLRSFFELGARYMTLTHFTHTPWADSSGQLPVHDGLTAWGRGLVREMNRLGMMVDVSHVADKTFFDALAASAAPVIASHSSCRRFSSHARNLSDEMLGALAKNRGVAHINFYNPYLDQGFRERYDALKKENAREDEIDAELWSQPARRGPAQRKLNAQRIAKLGRVPFPRLLDHFEHVVKVAGIDHVGLGSDFDGVSDQLPEGMEDISRIPNLARGLLERGFSDNDVEKILGGNTLRVMREVEQAARKMRPSPE